jgi:hypothetical protein
MYFGDVMPRRKRTNKPAYIPKGKPASEQVVENAWRQAWDCYCEGGSLYKIAQIVGLSYQTVRSKLPGLNWREKREKFLNGEDVGMPWIGVYSRLQATQRRVKDVSKAGALNNLPPEKKQMAVKAFSLFCAGMSLDEVASQLNMPLRTLELWAGLQQWRKCKKLAATGGAYTIEGSDDLPDSLQAAAEATRAVAEAFKLGYGEVMMKALAHVKEWDEETLMDRINDVKKLGESAEKILIDKKPEVIQQFNLTAPIEKVEVQDDFDVKL